MCAIFGITSHPEAAKVTHLGLHALQHRGQEGSGIVSIEGSKTYSHRQKGLVGKIFKESVLKTLKGHAAIGHNRYSTTGPNNLANLQPLLMKSNLGTLSIVHNGNLVNANRLTNELEEEGSIFQSTNDTEVIIHLMARSRQNDVREALIEALSKVEGAYSILLLTQDYMIAIKDPHGFRPLVVGNLNGKTVFASETCAFDLIGAEYVRDLDPGEMVTVALSDGQIVHTCHPLPQKSTQRCIFEQIYFARPDSFVFGDNVHLVRKALGAQLAKEHPAPGAEVVIPVPDSGVAAAIGYAEASGIAFDMGIVRSHYVGRTFIEPQQNIRNFGVRLKLSPISAVLKDKKIVVVDDSIVRGTTSKKLVKNLRQAGAKEIHLRISAPPTIHPCYYGIDTPTHEELLAANNSLEFIQDYIGVDSLGYLSLEGLLRTSTARSGEGFCHACFSGEYATPIENELN